MTIFSKFGSAKVLLLLALFLPIDSFANTTHTPSSVFNLTDQSNRIVEQLIKARGITIPKVTPKSRETEAQPMHVYELSTALLQELYDYALNHELLPPPIVISTSIQYSPGDVHKLLTITRDYLLELHAAAGIETPIYTRQFSNKTTADVYQSLFELYYKLNLFNGREKVSPNEVFSQVSRAKDDLRTTMTTMARRLDDDQERTKRLLYTAAYGINVDGTVMPPFEGGKKPVDPLSLSFEVRGLLNQLRMIYGIKEVPVPSMAQFSEGVEPIDVFLQIQFIIAEINTLKEPLTLYHVLV